MKERPILFSGPMVRALLAGTKTQTRRVVAPQPERSGDGLLMWGASRRGMRFGVEGMDVPPGVYVRCPYGQPGDRLWVRETFARIDGQTRPWIETDYKATYAHGDRLGDSLGIRKKWSPSIHMPRHASRITLEITSVRVERLQDISSCDAIAEGIEACPHGGEWRNYLDRPPYRDALTPRVSFRSLWDSINGPGSWDANPWVWALNFRHIDTEGGAA